MTPAQLTTTMRAIFGEYKPCISSSELHQVLVRVLGDEPEKPAPEGPRCVVCDTVGVLNGRGCCEPCDRALPPWRKLQLPAPPSAPLREPVTMVAKDRAAEMAAEFTPRSGADPHDVMFGTFGKQALRLRGAGENIIFLRAILATALYEYGDEMIEKTAQMLEVQGHNSAAGLARVMKSTPPKDNR